MIINRLSGMVLPYSTKFLVDNVVGKQQIALLTPLVLTVIGATVIQGITSFTLTQLLSKAGQRLIAELRQQGAGTHRPSPVAYYDANKTGALVAHHERRGRRAQPDRHRPGGIRGRHLTAFSRWSFCCASAL